MPRLVLLNGAPGMGKTTLALRYVADHPMAFCLDLDLVRRLIGSWQQRPQESGLAARRMAIVMAAEHLLGGHDVVVPQYLGRPVFIDELAAVAARTGSDFHEIALVDDREAAVRRFHARADDPALAAHHREALTQIDGDGGFEVVHGAYTALVAALA